MTGGAARIGGPEGAVVLGRFEELAKRTNLLERALNLGRGHSLWYYLFATACCGIELMQTGGPRTDLDRFGMVFRATPRQSDLMIFAGTITYKMARVARLLYEQMADPKYVIAMGSCANTGGLFRDSYAVVKGIDLFVPVDVFVPGCPPRPEALCEAMLRIQDIIKSEKWKVASADRRNGPERSR